MKKDRANLEVIIVVADAPPLDSQRTGDGMFDG